jgi:hypothetical protein
LDPAKLFLANYYLALGVAAAIAFFLQNSWEFRLEARPAYAYGLAGMLIASVLLLGGGSPFLYFQF